MSNRAESAGCKIRKSKYRRDCVKSSLTEKNTSAKLASIFVEAGSQLLRNGGSLAE
jgi:hypothetical protein